MGGLIGKLSDLAATHYRMLNTSKGYSTQGLRALLDREIYRTSMIAAMRSCDNLSIIEAR
jgi:tRNA U34 5-carboxymethylaminomethyl modifying enzyme MnmG/GidA